MIDPGLVELEAAIARRDTLGIDVSEYQAATPPLRGLSFLFARASIGTRPDARYARHIFAARRAGLLVGAYHFNDRHLAPTAQARAFLAAAGDVDFYFLDVEGADAMTPAQIQTFFAEVRRAGKRVGLYHSASGFPHLGQDYDWVAEWDTAGRPPAIPWTFWQFRGSPLDLDRYNGSPDQLRELAHPGHAAPSVHATVTAPTALYNPATARWVYNGRNALKPGLALVVRTAQYVRGGRHVYPVGGPAPFVGYFVPVDHVKLGGPA